MSARSEEEQGLAGEVTEAVRKKMRESLEPKIRKISHEADQLREDIAALSALLVGGSRPPLPRAKPVSAHPPPLPPPKMQALRPPGRKAEKSVKAKIIAYKKEHPDADRASIGKAVYGSKVTKAKLDYVTRALHASG
jgi:hypothetical protein